MSQRRPLTVLHNECFARRTVQRTYGRKGKASAALLGTQDFFEMTNELEKKLAEVSISEHNDRDEKENESSTGPVQDTKQSNVKRKKTVEPIARARPKEKGKALEDDFDTSSLEVKESGLIHAASDHEVITKFAIKHSDRGILSFRAYGNKIDKRYDVAKIGEGTYSNVFALTHKDVSENSNKISDHRTTIVKLMPISLPSQGYVEDMTELDALANEVQTLKVMDSIHGFIRYRGVIIVRGSWAANFYKAFRGFALRYPKRSYHKDPSEAFSPNQHYALIEMGYAGVELSEIKRPSAFQTYDIFWSSCIHLANSESQVQFEHRDMHVSNICIKPADPATERNEVEETTVAEMKEKPEMILGMSNIGITLIDYTYGRLTFPSNVDPNRGNTYRDFWPQHDYDELDKSFDKQKKAKNGAEFEERIQTLTYAKVGKCVDVNFERAYEEGRQRHPKTNELLQAWEHHVPQSNVCWLGYLLACLMHRAGKLAKTKYLAGSNSMAKEFQDEIWGKLLTLKDCVLEDDLDAMPKSAADVIRIGVENGWLSKAEIEAFKARLEEQES